MKNRLHSLPLRDIKITDEFWSRSVNLVRSKIIPYQWEILNDRIPGVEKSHCISNFEITAGRKKGKFAGMVFQDTDLAKWLEAVAYCLECIKDENLEKLADQAIELIGEAQQPDGYINTYFTIKEPGKRWSNLQEGHELYTAGHMIEAAVAYFNATSKDKLLNIMRRFADYIDTVFGPEDGKLKAYPGHQEIELALVKLYEATNDQKYLNLAKFFIDERGKTPNYFEEEKERNGHKYIFPEFELFDASYNQSHCPVREQTTAEGHAVRATYMYCGMADVAAAFQDESLLEACRTLYNNIVTKRMYITGSIGSAPCGERFTSDYDLPNDTNYSETCASVGLARFSLRMMQIEQRSCYADTFERALYNTILAGISLSGTEFFYVNPLEVNPLIAENNPCFKHVMTERQTWFGTACCPPNIARTLASLGQYIYAISVDEIYINLFIANSCNFALKDQNCNIIMESCYPSNPNISIIADGGEYHIAIRVPQYCSAHSVKVDGAEIKNLKIEDGYIKLKENWHNSKIDVELDIPIVLLRANPQVKYDVGKTAINKGPMVYCLEECDNGKNLSAIFIDKNTTFEQFAVKSLPTSMMGIKANGKKAAWDSDNKLYSTDDVIMESIEITAVPYLLWGNRGKGEMTVWMNSL